MDGFQALALIGLDGPDHLSPKAEILAEIKRLSAFPKPHHKALTEHITTLKAMARTATE